MEIGDLVKFREDIDIDFIVGIILEIDGHRVRVLWAGEDEVDDTWFVNLEVFDER